MEIDPAVYEAARAYFGLKHPGDDRVFLEDARGWVHKRVATQLLPSDMPHKFDMVIHDCFSGGGIPKHLYSLEFWNELKAIMTTGGVVAVVRLHMKSFLHPNLFTTEYRWKNQLAVLAGHSDDFAQSIRSL